MHDTNFPRAAVASKEGLHGAFAVPILLGAEVLGILEFFGGEIREPDEELLAMLATVGGEIGQFSEKWRAEANAEENRLRYEDLFESAEELIQCADIAGKLTYVNPSWVRTLGYSQAEARGLSMFQVIAAEYHSRCQAVFEGIVQSEKAREIQVEFIGKDGRRIFVEGHVSCKLKNGKPVETRGMFRDVTQNRAAEEAVRRLEQELKQALEHEKEVSRLDFATEVSNRRAFYEIGALEIARLRRYHRPLSLAFFDLDNFKQVNDTLGHAVGDALLIMVARGIRDSVRESDVVARLGGDEFALLMPETGGDPAAAVVEKLRGLLLATAQKEGWPVGLSIGLITFISPPASVEEMLKAADELMYEAKRGGKGKVVKSVVGTGDSKTDVGPAHNRHL